MGGQVFLVHPWLVVEALQLSRRRDLKQVAIAALVLSQKNEVGGSGIAFHILLSHAPRRDIDLAADDRLDPHLLGCLIKLQDAKHDAVIGQGQCRHVHFGCSLA